MMPTHEPQSRYQPLPHNSWNQQPRPWSHILTLEPGAGASPLRVNLSIIDIQHCPPYEALSYVWGKSKSPRPLLRDGHLMLIHLNLETALLSLRLPDRPRRLWADAICVDQDNIPERNAQVQIMSLIYRHASRVILWLGPWREGVGDAFALAARLRKIRSKLPYKPNDNMRMSPAAGHNLTPTSVRKYVDPASPAWKHLSDIFALEWWERVWCIQELAFATDCVARCGNLETPAVNLLASAVYVSYFRGSWESHGTLWFWNDIYLAKFREPAHSNGCITKGRPLVNILGPVRDFRATDDRDKIFAVLGLTREILNPSAALWNVFDGDVGVQQSKTIAYTDKLSNLFHGKDEDMDSAMTRAMFPDYEKPLKTVYCNVTRFLIRRYHLLNILSEVEYYPDKSYSDKDHPGRDELPSWVPHYFESKLASPFGGASWFLAGLCDGYRQWLSPEHHHRLHRRTRNPDVVSLDGFLINRVTKVTDVILANSQDTLVFDVLWHQIFGMPLLPLSAYDIRQVESFGITLTAGLPFNRPYDEIGTQVSAGQIDLPPGNHFLRAAALVHAHMRKVYELARTGARREILNNTHPNDEVTFQNHAKKAAYGRRVYLMENGLLGLGPAPMQPGDEVAVLIGGRVPFVLRRKAPGWVLIGETYVDDVYIMTGKAANSKRSELQTFDIY